MRLERLAYACFASLALKTDAGRRAPRPSLLATGGLGDAREGSAPFLTSLEACPFRGTYTVPSHFRALNWHITVPVASSTILKDVEWMSRGRVMLSTGTLYGALRRLLDQGWIERFTEDESPRDRRAYRVTSRGRR